MRLADKRPLTTAQSNTYNDPQIAVRETLGLIVLGRGLRSTMECVQDGQIGKKCDPFFRGIYCHMQ